MSFFVSFLEIWLNLSQKQQKDKHISFLLLFFLFWRNFTQIKTADSANLFVKGQKQLGYGLVSAIDAHMRAKWRLDLLPNSRLLQMEA
jgi:hypothetical protein